MLPLLFLLPGLRITRREKLALTSIFSLSAIVIIVAIIRVVQTSATTQHVDPVWLALWSSIESSVGKAFTLFCPFIVRSSPSPQALMVSCLPTFRILISKRNQSSGAYVHKPSTNSSSPRDRFSPAIRLDPIHQHNRDFSDVETLTRQSDEHYSAMHGEHDIDQRRTSMIMGTKTASQSSIPKGNIRIRNEFVRSPFCLWRIQVGDADFCCGLEQLMASETTSMKSARDIESL